MEEIKEDRDQNYAQNVLGGRPLNFYFKIVIWPAVILVVIEIIISLIWNKDVLNWFLDFLLFIGLSWYFIKSYQAKQIQVIILSIFSGLIIGFLLALFKLIWLHKVYLFFGLITESLITASAGLLISAASYLFFTREYKKYYKDKPSKNISSKK
jgi:DNA integrity scanning protein DisA with diadenylate cyclase activity